MLVSSSLLPIFTLGIAPVHPDAPDYDTLQQHQRRRLAVQLELLHPSLCTFLDNEECLQRDNEMKSNARHLQDITQAVGFVRVLVLLVKFTDHMNRTLPPVADYDTIFNDSGETPLIAPTGSVSSWLRNNSYGKFNMEAEIVPWHVTNNTEAYFSVHNYGLSDDFRLCMFPILDQLETEGFNFSRFDLNNDGVIDSIGTSLKQDDRCFLPLCLFTEHLLRHSIQKSFYILAMRLRSVE